MDKSLLNSLVTNAPLQDGFFNTSVGNGSDRVYGLGWCRADVSPETCSKCLNDSIRCPLSSSSSTYGGNGLDDPDVFTRGFSMMETLRTNVSNQPLKFATSVIDVGENGKRKKRRTVIVLTRKKVSGINPWLKCLVKAGQSVTTQTSHQNSRKGKLKLFERFPLMCGPSFGFACLNISGKRSRIFEENEVTDLNEGNYEDLESDETTK
ncbi:hypothetical protein L1987_58742 [Smallanthus sonchifolius]|uniref:Uncharacterized protein n=1 Tax=Smallanthus sonchifolius TaxID=185202 RepID=A0ACB9D3H0_9ASTR|nr:hypothetical protein L1987_58742 [Smallanthus sonchifolius]